MFFSCTKFPSGNLFYAIWCYLNSATYTDEHFLYTKARYFAFDGFLVYLSILIHQNDLASYWQNPDYMVSFFLSRMMRLTRWPPIKSCLMLKYLTCYEFVMLQYYQQCSYPAWLSSYPAYWLHKKWLVIETEHSKRAHCFQYNINISLTGTD